MRKHLQEFEEGHITFKSIKFEENEERLKRLVEEGQSPKALFIGCCDSRVMPSQITGSNAGDLFITRNIGNFVPPFNPDDDYHATASAIEYSVSILEVSDIIVCGHSQCGAIAALYSDIKQTEENIHTIKWLELGKDAKRAASLAFNVNQKEEMLRYTEKISVVYQLDNLLTYPAVKRSIEDGTLFLHGWHYNMSDGNISYYDNYEFKPLSEKIKA